MYLCNTCDGSGESRQEGYRCQHCKGLGVEQQQTEETDDE